ncbi:hypothetical protein H6H01_35280 [Nostoc calcicola FACHB-3891]|nr:hypothetical protein [Nostoc calcicola FACHB-3891]
MSIALTLPQQAMSNDKPLRVYALFVSFLQSDRFLQGDRTIRYQIRCSV